MSLFCGIMSVNPFFPANLARNAAEWMKKELDEAGHSISINQAFYEIYRWYNRPTTTLGMKQQFQSDIIYRRLILNQIMNEFTENDSDRTYATDNTDDGEEDTERVDP